ncbi:MAG: hypothetical protein AAFZ65_07840 [Planctomycetota bacterium]
MQQRSRTDHSPRRHPATGAVVCASPLLQSWLWWSERPGSSPADRC